MTIHEHLSGRQTVPLSEAAKLLGVGKTTLWDAMKRGEVPNAGVGSAKRVPAWFLLQKLTPPTPRCST